jgi:hypothetical protein
MALNFPGIGLISQSIQGVSQKSNSILARARLGRFFYSQLCLHIKYMGAFFTFTKKDVRSGFCLKHMALCLSFS